MSRKCRGGSCSHPAVRHRSGSTTCSTMVVWYFRKNGRICGGSSGIARAMMYLCGSKPHAEAGAGIAIAKIRAQETIDLRVRIRCHSLSHQSPQGSQVAGIPRVDVALPPALGRVELRRLEQHRQAREPRIGQDPPEGIEPETALADVLVAIDT